MKYMKPTAYKLKIWDLVQGQYIRSVDESEPAYLLTPWNQRVTRARIMGTVVDKFVREDRSYATLRLDDGSETISVRAWREGVPELDRLNIGSTVDIIGRVREFEGEIYLIPELILPVCDPNWELARELEIIESKREALASGVWPRAALTSRLEPAVWKMDMSTATPAGGPPVGEEEPPMPEIPEEVKKRIFLALEKLDRGRGTTLSEISLELNMPQPQVEEAIRVFLVRGDVFEPMAGRFKLMR